VKTVSSKFHRKFRSGRSALGAYSAAIATTHRPAMNQDSSSPTPTEPMAGGSGRPA
jgi:hypothetical protein